LQYIDIWNATGGYPATANLDNGSMYVCTTGGTVSGIVYTFGDVIIWNLAQTRWDLKDSELGIYAAEFLRAYSLEALDAELKRCRIGGKYPHSTPYILPFHKDQYSWLVTTPSYVDSIASMTKAIVQDAYIDEMYSPLEVKGTSATTSNNKIALTVNNTGTLGGHTDFTMWLSSSILNSANQRIGVVFTFNYDGMDCTFAIYLNSMAGARLQTAEGMDQVGGTNPDFAYDLDPTVPVFISIQYGTSMYDIKVFVNGEYIDTFEFTTALGIGPYLLTDIEIKAGNNVDGYILGFGSTNIDALYMPFSAQDHHTEGSLDIRDVSITEILQSGDAFVDDDHHLMTAAKANDQAVAAIQNLKEPLPSSITVTGTWSEAAYYGPVWTLAMAEATASYIGRNWYCAKGGTFKMRFEYGRGTGSTQTTKDGTLWIGAYGAGEPYSNAIVSGVSWNLDGMTTLKYHYYKYTNTFSVSDGDNVGFNWRPRTNDGAGSFYIKNVTLIRVT